MSPSVVALKEVCFPYAHCRAGRPVGHVNIGVTVEYNERLKINKTIYLSFVNY